NREQPTSLAMALVFGVPNRVRRWRRQAQGCSGLRLRNKSRDAGTIVQLRRDPFQSKPVTEESKPQASGLANRKILRFRTEKYGRKSYNVLIECTYETAIGEGGGVRSR